MLSKFKIDEFSSKLLFYCDKLTYADVRAESNLENEACDFETDES